MTQQEIQERNKQIALMLGWHQNPNKFNFWVGDDKLVSKDSFVETRDLTFHSDWNWLMEAVEFIESLNNGSCYSIKIVNNKCEIFINTQYALAYDKHLSVFQKLDCKKEAVFIAVSDFAKYWNSLQK